MQACCVTHTAGCASSMCATRRSPPRSPQRPAARRFAPHPRAPPRSAELCLAFPPRPQLRNGATVRGEPAPPTENNMRRQAGTQERQRQPAAQKPCRRALRCVDHPASTAEDGVTNIGCPVHKTHLKQEASAHARSGAARSACCRESAHCKAVGRHACREEERCSEQQGGRAHRHGAHRHGGLRTKSL